MTSSNKRQVGDRRPTTYVVSARNEIPADLVERISVAHADALRKLKTQEEYSQAGEGELISDALDDVPVG